MVRCQKCGKPIEKGKEKFVDGKIVCHWCYFRIRRKNTTKKMDLQKEYERWLDV